MTNTIARTYYSKNEKVPELIVCAAIKYFNITDPYLKIVIPCIRHHDVFIDNILYYFSYDEWEELLQGFLTNYGRFVGRKEALKIAKANNQIICDIGYEPDKLYSEMLY